MPRTIRIGIQIAHDEPFWVQVREVLWQRAQTIAAELIEIAAEESRLLSSDTNFGCILSIRQNN